MNKKFYITTPIYYVNDEPHLGHAYSTITADIFARYHRLFSDRVFFLTGTDEHGQKVAEAARKANRTPQEHCDLMVQRFQAVWHRLNISNDDFIRTTEMRHTGQVQEILQQLYDAGEIYEDQYEGWYCIPEERFWTEKDLVEGNCPSCGRGVQRLTEKNYFFRMSKYQGWLIEHIKSHPRFILPESRRNEILGFLAQPLDDLCISRPVERLSWGIPLPFDKNFVTYVWFDALFNYYTAPRSKGGNWWPATIHLIGKDILTTHCVYWPTMLKAAKLDLPETIFGTGWWLMEETKMSKSLKNVVDPLEMSDKYGVDALRFFVVREMSLGKDASFSEAALVNRYNSELANDLGNLYSRLLKLLHTYCDAKIPSSNENGGTADEISGAAISRLNERVRGHVENIQLNAALDEVMAFVRGINRAVETAAPWKTGQTDPEGTRRFLRQALEATAQAACLLHPVMPQKMSELLEGVGVEDTRNPHLSNDLILRDGEPLPKSAALFPRIKPEAVATIPVQESKEAELVSIEEFRRMKLKVARILEASPAPNSNNLLKLKVSLGDEERTLVAGIATHYKPDDLVGKHIVVVTNLKPAMIRGIESRGMLLAAVDKNALTLIVPDDDIPPGANVS